MAIIVFETRPLLAIEAERIDALAHAGKARIDIGIGIGIIGEDRLLLGLQSTRRHHCNGYQKRDM